MEAPLLKELRKLEELQKLDFEIFKKEELLEDLPAENERLEKETTEMNSKLRELKDNVAIQFSEKEKRLEILSKGEEKLKGITGKQSAIKNKDEYNAILREIDNIKRFNKELEEEISEINKEISIKNGEISLIEESYVTKTAENEAKTATNKEIMETLEKEIDALDEKREVFANTIRPVVRRKYERIFESSRDGTAVVTADNYICKGCNMTLPPQLYNNVLKSAKIEMCPNCQRILLPPHKESGEA